MHTMPKATHTDTTTTLAPDVARIIPGRRGLLGGAAALLAGAAAVALPRAALAADADPVLALWRRYVDTERQQDLVFRPAVALRAALTARWGELWAPLSATQLWDHDPEYPTLLALNAESDRLNWIQTEIGDEITATPATSLAELRIKVRLAMSLWPRGERLEETDDHEDVALAVLQDADRLLATHGEG
jgi:hypothetical protein